jgi:transketolase N-terminal domain/subunit
MSDRFPIDLGRYRPVPLDPSASALTGPQRAQIRENIALCRDTIVFFTAIGAARGVGGHTGGPYDIVPEVVLADGFFRGSDRFVPVFFDEAGHRVAIQYLFAVLRGHMKPERLLHYREAHARLPGHPERGHTEGVEFSSGRLGHLWPYVNGVAAAHRGRTVLLFGSDGSQMEGNDAEAARHAVARSLDVKLLLDDNDVTIAGRPSEYLPGFAIARTLEGHGLKVFAGEGEDLEDLFRRMTRAFAERGPAAVVNRRPMAPGIAGLQGSAKAHDVIAVDLALAYLESRGQHAAAAYLRTVEKPKDTSRYRGSSKEESRNRDLFGVYVCDEIQKLPAAERARRVLAIDADLEGSCGMHHIG